MRIHAVRRRWLMIVFFLLLAGFSSGPGALRADSGPSFSGQATVVRATVPPLSNISIVVSDTGPLPPSGGAQEASLVAINEPNLVSGVVGVSAEVAHAATVGQHDRSRSEASVATLGLTVAGNTIGADFLMARATAACGPGGASTSGSSELVGLVINGQSVVVSGAPNQTIALPMNAGQVIINEQKSNGPGDITVNALHVIVTGIADVVIASAHADITCPAPPPPPTCPGTDFVTGGGWIVSPSDAGSKANFAVAGGIKNGTFWGHLQYIDHGNGLRVKGTGVTAYSGTAGTTTRHIEGTADINGSPGTYMADVADNGEPGRNDTFSLTLSPGGYTASGTLSGGNIQLHTPCQ